MKDRETKSRKVSFETNPDPENAGRCPGFRFVKRENGYKYLVRCTQNHPHQTVIRRDADGAQEVTKHGFLWKHGSHGGALSEDELDARLEAKERRISSKKSREMDRARAQGELKKIRHQLGKLKKEDRHAIRQALQNPTPNVQSFKLPDKPETDHCRCGRRFVEADWNKYGVQKGPSICPGCRDLPQYCSCMPSMKRREHAN